MIVLGIDPGPITSGVVVYDSKARRVLYSNAAEPNTDTDSVLMDWAPDAVVIEKPKFMGFNPRRMGQSIARTQKVIETAYQAGQMHARCEDGDLFDVHTMSRQDVLNALGVKVKGDADAAVTKAVCRLLTGDPAWSKAKGTIKAKGPAYSVSSHAWQALGLVLAWLETQGGEQ